MPHSGDPSLSEQEAQALTEYNIRSRLFFYAIFAVLIVLALLLLQPFLSVIAISVITIIILKPLYSRYLKVGRVARHERVAASMALGTFILALLVPISFIVYITASQLVELFNQVDVTSLQAILEDISTTLARIVPGTSDPLDSQQLATTLAAASSAAQSAIAEAMRELISSLPNLMMQGIIFLVLVVTLLPEFDGLVKRFQEISPLGTELSELYYRKTTAMITSLVRGVFLIAVIQGTVMGFFFWLADVSFAFLLGLISMVLALVPVVGISYLALFTAFVLAISGRWVDAAIVLFGFYGVVNWIDLILRPRLISREAYLNFALVLLGLLGGLIWAGLLGLILGPVIILLLVTTIDIYAELYAKEDGVVLRSLVERRRQPADSATP